MPTPKWNNVKTDDLLNAVLALKNLNEAKQFFRDLLTAPEIVEFGNRWWAAQMLDAKIPYIAIQKETGLSSRTIARIARWLSQGKGGYKLMIKRLGSYCPKN